MASTRIFLEKSLKQSGPVFEPVTMMIVMNDSELRKGFHNRAYSIIPSS